MRLLEEHEIPSQLYEIPEPPKQLWIEGVMPAVESIFLVIVGSRKCTTYGRDACEKIISGLKGYPLVIVSGLALGMDTLVHENALKAGLTTIAFPGSGLSNKVLYPRSNWNLANKIIKEGGALISELDPETKAEVWTFPKRNRLMAGIAKATLIIEAEQKSGSLVTARLTLDYNRDLCAVPGSIFSPYSVGTNWLIKEGAMPIRDATDILHVLGFSPEDREEIPSKVLSPDEVIVYDLVAQPLSKELLAIKLSKPMDEVNILISKMEIEGLVKEDFGMIRRI